MIMVCISSFTLALYLLVPLPGISSAHAFISKTRGGVKNVALIGEKRHYHEKLRNEHFPLSSGLISPEIPINVAYHVHPSVALVTPIGVRNMTNRGSGFIIDFNETTIETTTKEKEEQQEKKYTYLITAAHVASPGQRIEIHMYDNNGSLGNSYNSYPATIVARNMSLDLALIKTELNNDKRALSFSKGLDIATSAPPVGTIAFAHGYPASRIQGPTMTSGIVCGIADGLGMPDYPSVVNNKNKSTVSSTIYDKTTYVVTDAAMAGGMSGGPLTDYEGKVIGVNALIRPDLRALGNYAVSSNEILDFLDHVLQTSPGTTTSTSSTTPNDGTTGVSIQKFNVVLFNDPMNKKERVSSILENIALLEKNDANRAMMEAHREGRGIIKEFDSQQDADTLCMTLRDEDILVEVEKFI